MEHLLCATLSHGLFHAGLTPTLRGTIYHSPSIMGEKTEVPQRGLAVESGVLAVSKMVLVRNL